MCIYTLRNAKKPQFHDLAGCVSAGISGGFKTRSNEISLGAIKSYTCSTPPERLRVAYVHAGEVGCFALSALSSDDAHRGGRVLSQAHQTSGALLCKLARDGVCSIRYTQIFSRATCASYTPAIPLMLNRCAKRADPSDILGRTFLFTRGLGLEIGIIDSLLTDFSISFSHFYSQVDFKNWKIVLFDKNNNAKGLIPNKVML